MIYKFKNYTPVVHESAFVHSQAAVTGNVVIGKDVYIAPGAAIRGDWGRIVIKDGCNVQEGNDYIKSQVLFFRINMICLPAPLLFCLII